MSIKRKISCNDKDCGHKWYPSPEVWEDVTLSGKDLEDYRKALVDNKLHLIHLPKLNAIYGNYKKDKTLAFNKRREQYLGAQRHIQKMNNEARTRFLEIANASIFTATFWRHLFKPKKSFVPVNEDLPELSETLSLMSKEEMCQKLLPIWFKTADLDARRQSKTQCLNATLWYLVMNGDEKKLLDLLNLTWGIPKE